MSQAIVEIFHRSDSFIDGGFALEQGFIFTSMLLAAATVCVIERHFVRAGLWCLAGAGMSLIGLVHSYRFTAADTAVHLAPAWPFVISYACMAACFFLARYVTVPAEGPGH